MPRCFKAAITSPTKSRWQKVAIEPPLLHDGAWIKGVDAGVPRREDHVLEAPGSNICSKSLHIETIGEFGETFAFSPLRLTVRLALPAQT